MRRFGVQTFALLCCFALSSTAYAQVLINEIVTDPQVDWNDSEGGNGVRFDDVPGTAPATETDEWVELLNVSGTPVNLTSWTLYMFDTTPSSCVLGSTQYHAGLSSGSTVAGLQPMGRLVIGNPPGAINNNSHLVLRNANGTVVDEVELGDLDFAADGTSNNAPSGDAHGGWDEAIGRVPDGVATGNPARDFRPVRASIGAPNPDPPPAATVLINEVVTDPLRDWNDTAGGNGVPFDGDAGTSTPSDSDEWIELINVSLHPASIVGWTLVMHDSTPSTETLGRGGADFFAELGSPPDRILPGEHFVVGNPLGSMNNNVWIRLIDTAGRVVDDVELGGLDYRGDGAGNEAPGGNAWTISDESVARLPDAHDTGVDADDFVERTATIGRANSVSRVHIWQLYR